ESPPKYIKSISTLGFCLSTSKWFSQPAFSFQPSLGITPAATNPSQINLAAAAMLSGSLRLSLQYQVITRYTLLALGSRFAVQATASVGSRLSSLYGCHLPFPRLAASMMVFRSGSSPGIISFILPQPPL